MRKEDDRASILWGHIIRLGAALASGSDEKIEKAMDEVREIEEEYERKRLAR